MFARMRRYLRRRKYAAGTTLTRFLAPDIRRDIEIVGDADVDAGYVMARVRTWNVLYVARGFEVMPELDPARRIAIAELWH